MQAYKQMLNAMINKDTSAVYSCSTLYDLIQATENGDEPIMTARRHIIGSFYSNTFVDLEYAPKIDLDFPQWKFCAIYIGELLIRFNDIVNAVQNADLSEADRIAYLSVLMHIDPYSIILDDVINAEAFKRIKTMKNFMKRNSDIIMVDPFDYPKYMERIVETHEPTFDMKSLSKIKSPVDVSPLAPKQVAHDRVRALIAKYIPDDFDWTGIVVAGGCIAKACMVAQSAFINNRSDVDFFIYGKTRKDSIDAFNRLMTLFKDYKAGVFMSVCSVYDVMASKVMQIISVDADNAAAIPCRFDLSNCQWMYDGTHIKCSPMALTALREMTTYVVGNSVNFSRFAKAHANGYAIYKSFKYVSGNPFIYSEDEVKKAYAEYAKSAFSPPDDILESTEDIEIWLADWVATHAKVHIMKDFNTIKARFEHRGHFSNYNRNYFEMALEDIIEKFKELLPHRTLQVPLRDSVGKTIMVFVDDVLVKHIGGAPYKPDYNTPINDVLPITPRFVHLCNIMYENANNMCKHFERRRTVIFHKLNGVMCVKNTEGSYLDINRIVGRYPVTIIFYKAWCTVRRIHCLDKDEPGAIIRQEVDETDDAEQSNNEQVADVTVEDEDEFIEYM